MLSAGRFRVSRVRTPHLEWQHATGAPAKEAAMGGLLSCVAAVFVAIMLCALVGTCRSFLLRILRRRFCRRARDRYRRIAREAMASLIEGLGR